MIYEHVTLQMNNLFGGKAYKDVIVKGLAANVTTTMLDVIYVVYDTTTIATLFTLFKDERITEIV